MGETQLCIVQWPKLQCSYASGRFVCSYVKAVLEDWNSQKPNLVLGGGSWTK